MINLISTELKNPYIVRRIDLIYLHEHENNYNFISILTIF